MLQTIVIYAAMMIAVPAMASEARDVAAAAAPQAMELPAVNPKARSFFEPKTQSDVNALATLEQDLVSSLNREISN